MGTYRQDEFMQHELDSGLQYGNQLVGAYEQARPLTDFEKYEAMVKLGQVDPAVAAHAHRSGMSFEDMVNNLGNQLNQPHQTQNLLPNSTPYTQTPNYQALQGAPRAGAQDGAGLMAGTPPPPARAVPAPTPYPTNSGPSGPQRQQNYNPVPMQGETPGLQGTTSARPPPPDNYVMQRPEPQQAPAPQPQSQAAPPSDPRDAYTKAGINLPSTPPMPQNPRELARLDAWSKERTQNRLQEQQIKMQTEYLKQFGTGARAGYNGENRRDIAAATNDVAVQKINAMYAHMDVETQNNFAKLTLMAQHGNDQAAYWNGLLANQYMHIMRMPDGPERERLGMQFREMMAQAMVTGAAFNNQVFGDENIDQTATVGGQYFRTGMQPGARPQGAPAPSPAPAPGPAPSGPPTVRGGPPAQPGGASSSTTTPAQGQPPQVRSVTARGVNPAKKKALDDDRKQKQVQALQDAFK